MTGSLLAKANQAGLPDCVTQAGNPVRGTSEACSNAGFFIILPVFTLSPFANFRK